VDVTGIFGPAVAFFAGMVSFLSPCVLPLVPVYLLQMAGTSSGQFGGRRVTFQHALSFVLGFSVVFILLGASVGFFSFFLQDNIRTITRVAGLILIVFGLHLSGVIRIPWLARTYQADLPGSRRRGYLGSALIGASFSIGWTPCVGPVLGSILTLAAESGTGFQGALLLTFYSLGLGVPFLITGLLAARATALFKRFNRALPVLETATGALLVLAGILVFTDRFTVFNQTFQQLGIDRFGVL
jgi:cytochrome c-type biogenesis protein